ncbi:hypothetical protein J7L48_06065 [bacterium]|nr:hypothetical protein [bacterium]
MNINNVYEEFIKFSQNDDAINGYIKKLLYNMILTDLYENERGLKEKIEKDFHIDDMKRDLEISEREVFYNTNDRDMAESIPIIKDKYLILYNFVGGADFFSHFGEPFENLEPDEEDYSDDTKIYSENPELEDYDPLAKPKYCFIATEVYGNIDHINVEKLRAFRNNVLLKYNAGRNFVKWYYKNGKYLANIIAKCPILKRGIKLILDLLV